MTEDSLEAHVAACGERWRANRRELGDIKRAIAVVAEAQRRLFWWILGGFAGLGTVLLGYILTRLG